MWSEVSVLFALTGAVICFAGLLGCVMTLASIAVGDPDPLAWARETGQMFSEGAGNGQD